MNGESIRVYSLKKDGHKYLDSRKHFKVREFRCKDGTDTIFISDALVAVLSELRAHFGKPCNISSGYRTDSHNSKVNGAAYSRHKYGMAADIKVTGVSASEVYAYLDERYPNTFGLGKATTYIHIDVRSEKARWTY